MVAIVAQEASSSRYSYDVFLNFRGEDTRKTFIDDLYTALRCAGIRTFRDDVGLERGQNIVVELKKAIQESRISIIVFSKDYASSRWCLDELLNILELKKTVGHMILPVFYHVDPSHVRNQTGSFADAFAIHEERFKAETEERKEAGLDKIKRWKTALKEVTDMAGMVLRDRQESSVIQEIVREIGKRLSRTVLSVGPYLVGINSRVEDINSWIQDGSMDVGIATICGMGGIGKTTIAKIVYNLNLDRFEGSSFLANFREMSKQPNGLVSLHKRLLSDILKEREEKISSVYEGIIKIRDAISRKRVLIVFDDVDESDQLNAVFMMQEWFYPGSKIVITTRDEQLLKAHERHKMHKVKELDFDESVQLFCRHAFGQDHPIEVYLEYSIRVVRYCGGLPVVLQVLGSSLSGRPRDVWESTLKKLEAIPDSQIIRKLKISFDSLQDDHDKNIFLDIACFFVRKDKEFTITILDECGFYTEVGIHNLIGRCLVTIDENNNLTMHQLVQDMGREIIHQESPKEPGKRSRLWHHNDAFSVLNEKTGTDSIEGLILNLIESKFNAKRRHSEDFLDKPTLLSKSNSVKRHRLGFFSWLPITYASTGSHSTSDEVDLRTDAFSRMHKLRLLQLNNTRLTGDYGEFPRTLRWLCWRGFPLESIPNDFPLESLVALDMRNSSLKQVWNGNKLLRSLKILNLSHSHRLIKTPDFSTVPNLERLILKNCLNLIEIHESSSELERLVLLNLKGCKRLRNLPSKIGQLKSLEILILSQCSKLERLPTELTKIESLKILHIGGTAINQSPSTTSEVKLWHSYFFDVWRWRSRRLESISFLLWPLSRTLLSLNLADCNLSDDAIPKDLGSLSLLQNLDLSRNPICSLPESIKCLIMLQELNLNNCKTLQLLPELPMSLRVLDLSRCRSLEKITNLPNPLKSLNLSIKFCGKLTEVQRLFKLEPIASFDKVRICNLGLSNLEFLRNIKVSLFNSLTITKRKVPIQGLYEFGIFSTSLPGSEVPGWFNFKSKGSLICFMVPSLPNLKIQGLNVCVVYTKTGRSSGNPRNKFCNEFYIKVSNWTKDLKWTYSPTFIGLPDYGKDMVWLSHWNFGNLLEAGDEVTVSVFLWLTHELKEFGIHVVFEEEEKGTPYISYPSCQNVNDGDLSLYQAGTRAYFLCHHDFDIQQWCSADDYWATSGWYDFLFGDSKGVDPISPQYKPWNNSETQSTTMVIAEDDGGKYEVFLSFRGADTCDTFTAYLYSHLSGVGVRTFLDDNELREGHEIGLELLKAITESKVSIPIFSKSYASSHWCLRELTEMVECKRNTGQLILPIFYDVEPSNVWHRSGSFEEAFRNHERCLDETTVEKWKEALKEVEALKGWEVNKEADDGLHQRKLIKDPTVVLELKRKSMVVTDYLVGMNHHLNEMMRLLNVISNEVQIIGIHGIGGIGKTAIAKFIYNKLFESFECHSFLANIQETVRKLKLIEEIIVPAVLLELKKLIMDVPDNLVGIDHHLAKMTRLLNVDSNEVQIVGICGISGIGKTTIAKFIYNKLFEIFECHSFLADIRETAQQCNGLVELQKKLLTDTLKWCPDISDVEGGMDVIKHVFRRKKVLLVLDDVIESSQFNWLVRKHAWFGSGSRIIVTSKDRNLLNDIKVDVTYEPPPFMTSVQSLQLFSIHAFRRKLPPEDYVSFSRKVASNAAGLPLALEVLGSFLSGKEKVVWEDTLEKLKRISHGDVERKLGISYEALSYAQRQIFLDIACLFTGMDKSTVFYMWDDCGYHPEIEFNVLCLMSLVKVEKDTNELRMHDQFRTLGRKIVYEEKILGKRSRLWNHADAMDVLVGRRGTEKVEALSLCLELGSGMKPRFTSKEFTKLASLRYLRADGIELVGDFEDLFPCLRWLRWRGCPPHFKPTNFHLKNLVILDLSDSSITENWGGWNQIKMAYKLKVLRLANCALKRTPDFSSYTTLEILILRRCRSLVEIESVSNLKKLKVLDISYTGIRKLPDEISMLENLEVIGNIVREVESD